MEKKRTGKFTPKKGVKKKTQKPPKKKIKSKIKKGDKQAFLPEVNIAVDKLPSKGLSYPKTVKINYRPYSWGEVKQISQSKTDEQDQFNFIMDGIRIEGMEKDQLTLGDAMFLAIYRKISTVGSSKVTVRYYCKGCRQESSFVFDTMGIEADQIKAPALPMKLDLGGKEYAFSPMTLADYFDMRDRIKDRPELYEEMALVASQCRNAEFDEIYRILYNVSNKEELDLIKQVDRYLNHGLKKIENKCSNKLDNKEENSTCGHVEEIELDGGQALLLPFREDERDVGDRIRFGS